MAEDMHKWMQAGMESPATNAAAIRGRWAASVSRDHRSSNRRSSASVSRVKVMRRTPP